MFYQMVADIICTLNGCTTTELLHSKQEYHTDARYLLIHLLSKRLTNQEIVRLSTLPKQTVSRIVNGYDFRRRQKYSLRCMQHEAEQQIAHCPDFIP